MTIEYLQILNDQFYADLTKVIFKWTYVNKGVAKEFFTIF